MFQDLATVPLMSIWRNFFLGSEPTKGAGPLRRVDVKFAQRTMRDEMRKMGIDVRDPDQPVGTLSGGERQAVAIARAVYFGAKVLILDEPTSALGVKQSGVVLRYVAQARDRGLGVIFITHNPHHAYPVGDRFVILNRGRLHGRLAQGRDHPRRARQADVRRRRARRARARAAPRAPRECVMSAATETVGAPRRRAAPAGAIGVGVIGFGWLGQAHSRSLLRIPTLFARARRSTPSSSSAATPLPERRDDAVALVRLRRAAPPTGARSSRTRRSTWSFIAAPNMLHVELVEAAAAAGKHVFCEKPVGGTPEQTVRARAAARDAGVISGVGYNYRWAPLVQYARAADRRRAPGRDHQLPRPLLLDVRQRPARRAVVALPASTRPATA